MLREKNPDPVIVVGGEWSSGYEQLRLIDGLICKIDWGDLKTWRDRRICREEEIDDGWGTCCYCDEVEDECGCNTDNTERFER